MNELERRRGPLYATLGFAVLEGDLREAALVHAWLDNCTGIGLIAARMVRQGYDISLTGTMSNGRPST